VLHDVSNGKSWPKKDNGKQVQPYQVHRKPDPIANVDGTKADASVDRGSSSDRKILSSWKEIAQYLGRGVRTVQRYEGQFKLPVRRMSGNDHSSVMAFSDEIDRWLNGAAMKQRRYVRPTIVVIDRAVPGTISSRKLILEVGRFNVLTAYTVEEAYSTAERFDVDGFVLDHIPGSETGDEVCESLKQRHPGKPIFLVTTPDANNSQLPRCADHVVSSADPQKLLDVVTGLFGPPRLE
jgi:CheY-like chemotaxis protein